MDRDQSYNQNQYSMNQQEMVNNSNQQPSYPSQLEQTVEQEQYQVLVRKADLDDIDELLQLITPDAQKAQDLLYDYPKLVNLFERSFLSVTCLNSEQKIIGCAVFNDYPQGLFGKIDFQHENFWEYWLFNAFEFDEDQYITPHNSLWMTYLFVAKERMGFEYGEEKKIIEKIFQNVYNSLPYVESILYLKRGESIDSEVANTELKDLLEEFFQQIPCCDRELIRKVRGIHSRSELYYSPKSACTEMMEIRMAREQDHDDLAEIFNRQSEVLTQQFGEFFIADLIATQNLTRRLKQKAIQNDGRAIVGQVRDKAVGLMSVSREIDYKLLAQCFELDTYDNLFKPEYMDAIRYKRDQIKEAVETQQKETQEKTQKMLQEEYMKCQLIGQRMTLQQYCIDIRSTVIPQIEELLSGEDKQKEGLSKREQVEALIDSWLEGYSLNNQMHFPSHLFAEYFDQFPDIESLIMNPREMLLETLEFFGLPKYYMLGAGHWKDWEKIKLEELKQASMRRVAKRTTTKTRKNQNKLEEEKNLLKPPKYFDIKPFQESFERFVSITPEDRTIFRQQVETNIKKVKMQFCKEFGEINPERSQDLQELGKTLNDEIKDIKPQIIENMTSFLQCFGDIESDEQVKLIPVQDTKAKQKGDQNIKKPPTDPQKKQRLQEIIQNKCNFEDFLQAINTYKKFDLMMCKLGYIKSSSLASEMEFQEQLEKEILKKQQIEENREHNNYDDDSYISQLQNTEELPDVIPEEAQNAVVINLYCIDENFESRSLDFVEYAFSLFPDKDYLILTQPYSVAETSLLQNFIQIPMKKNSTFDHVLYIYHKDAMQANSISVRKSQIQDLQNCGPLFDGLHNQQLVMKDCDDAIKNSSKGLEAFSVFCENQLIGVYVVSKTVNLDYYVSHFCIQDHIILNEHPKPFHTKLLHSILNPLFYKSTRFILREILRLTGKTCLYFEVENKTLLPDIFNELVFVRTRNFPYFLKRKWDFEHEPEHYERAGDLSEVQDGHRDPFSKMLRDPKNPGNMEIQDEIPFSLSMVTKKMLSGNKVSNNTRIVVVGASDTGVSLIESLLTIKDIHFTHITLLAPGGLPTMHINNAKDQLKGMSANYQMEELENLMLDARVSVLDAKMVKLDKKKKRIDLDKDAHLNYDILVIAVGLINTILQNPDKPLQIKFDKNQVEPDEHRLYSSGLIDSYYYNNQIGQQSQENVKNPYRFIDGVYTIDDPYLYDRFKNTGVKDSNIDLLTRNKRPQNITLYGRTIHTFAFISGLLNRGVHPSRINLVINPQEAPKKETFKDNQERLKYEDERINDPDPFEDDYILDTVLDYIQKIGVKIHHGFELYHIITDNRGDCKTVIFRKKAADYNEKQLEIEKTEELLKIKKQELKDENDGNSKIQDDISNEDEEESEIQLLQQQIRMLEESLNEDIEITSRFLITSGLVDIDIEIFQIIHDNGLVYNGRLIVKSNFQTTINEIFCCGKICEFSQRYKNDSVGRSLRLDKYNGRELGQKLSKCILEYLDLSYLTDQLYNSEQLPNLYMPIGIGCYLPGGLYYYHIKKNDFGKPKLTIDKKTNRQPLTSNNLKVKETKSEEGEKVLKYEGNYLSFNFDNNGLVDSVTYMGVQQVSVQSLISFVGLSENYFNQLQNRFQRGLIQDVSEFLSENWAIAMYHEWFSEFRHLTKTDILQSENIQNILNEAADYAREGKFVDRDFYENVKKKVQPEIIQAIQQGTLDFLSENQNHLPMYYVPENFPQKREKE